MENYKFVVEDEKLKERITATLIEKKYHVNVDPEKKHLGEDLNCFVFWSDGTRNCILTRNAGGDHQKEITEDNIEWFLSKL